ncbi:DUF1684 domain-containing protein [Cellulomonas sp. HZM]|uniref:DUF1684 domain-containing protein n=1 Tax=Cellulomonas sp. HZM TaxID=1454010 RepID=UPI0004933B6C|nr:DUF1684 domain-containing protein [Cellulomonas sp. HZM]
MTEAQQAFSTLDLVDWRRRVAAIYADVRRAADPARAHAGWVAARESLMQTHPASPLRSPAPVRVRPYDPAFRFVVDLEPAEPTTIQVPTGTDGTVPFSQVGVVTLPGLGSLAVWALRSYGGGLFLPVRDATCSSGDSYGGGRYLLDTVKGADLGEADGRLVVDLNFAYNPSCAYDPAWACPLPRPENTLDVAVTVGEVAFEG